jgi:ERO1-like protein beta
MTTQPTGPIETTLCDYETIESVNDVLFEELHSLVQTPFFKYFRVCAAGTFWMHLRNALMYYQVDLYRECPFWQENMFCSNHDCSVITVDEVCQ